MPFPSQEFTISTKEKTYRFLCPHDPNDVLNSITEQQYEKDKFLPYWAEHWPSAQVFFPFISNHPDIKDLISCELGCGLGVISAALSPKCASVFSVDISPQACVYAYENIRLNGGTPRVIASDWRAMPYRSQFDLIVASDVLYEQRWIEPILNCVKQLLKPNGKAWIADPCRRFWQEFKTTASEMGFQVRLIHQGEANEGKTRVEVIELTMV